MVLTSTVLYFCVILVVMTITDRVTLTDRVLDLYGAMRQAEADSARINAEICQKNVEEADADKNAETCRNLAEIDRILAESAGAD